MKQSRILRVLLTLEISTVLPDFACSIFRSRPLAVLRYVFACSRLFSLFALMAAFRYCFFLLSRNSSCSLTEKQLYRNSHSSDTANAPDTGFTMFSLQPGKDQWKYRCQIGTFPYCTQLLLGHFQFQALKKETSFLLEQHPSSKKTSQHFTSVTKVITALNLQAWDRLQHSWLVQRRSWIQTFSSPC